MRKEYENNKEYKRYLENRWKINCGRCPYNRKENRKKSDRKCWKHRTKARKQWEVGSSKSRELYDWVWTRWDENPWMWGWFENRYVEYVDKWVQYDARRKNKKVFKKL